ncbi:MAG: cytochrome c3 family protein [Thermodesulfobacteriota bacterium]
MKNILLMIFFGLSLFIARLTWAADESFHIIYPIDHSIIKWERVRVIGLVKDPSIKNLMCQVKGGEVIGSPIISVIKGAFTLSIRLKKGLNEISILDQSGRTPQEVSIYFSKEDVKPPEGFRPYFTHFPLDREEQCQDCHNLKGEPLSYKKIIPIATCSTGQCHSQMGKGKFVHGPVGSGTCIACHNPHGTLNPSMVTRPGGEGCYICHDTQREAFKGKVIHSPVSEGGCSDCHDPHQSSLKFQLKGASQQDLCFNCHDSNLVKQSNLHTPVKGGDCIACHNAHSSPNEKLLTMTLEKICFSCHEEMEKELKKKYIHKPVKGNCQKCHDPHASSQKAQLRKVQIEMCIDCHKPIHPKIIQSITGAKFPHQPIQKGNCSSCHGVHFTDFEKLLKSPLKDICFTCHKDLNEKVKTSKFFHGPVVQNDCAACHDTHGSPNPRILRSYFPAEFYIPYKTENYAICFDCHNKDIALNVKTLELTDFRNGDRNLHFVHVNKRKGRSCKACHEVHSGNQSKHIREEVPYGKMWSYPIRYTKTPTGGTCVVGCHKPLSYDRSNPVRY